MVSLSLTRALAGSANGFGVDLGVFSSDFTFTFHLALLAWLFLPAVRRRLQVVITLVQHLPTRAAHEGRNHGT